MWGLQALAARYITKKAEKEEEVAPHYSSRGSSHQPSSMASFY
jgi:hypothetical protein